MLREHSVSRFVNKRVSALVNLFVADHPIPIEKQKQRSYFKHINAVNGQFFVKGWWKFYLVGDNNSLTDPLVEKVECGQNEENWHAHAVHHGDVDDV